MKFEVRFNNIEEWTELEADNIAEAAELYVEKAFRSEDISHAIDWMNSRVKCRVVSGETYDFVVYGDFDPVFKSRRIFTTFEQQENT